MTLSEEEATMNARRAPKLTKICRLARWGLVSVLLPSYAFADAPCNVSGAPAGVLYMTVEAKITSNTATKNGDVTCDGASVANHTCFNVGDKQIQGLMLKGAKAPVSFSGWAGVAVKRALSRSSMEFARTGVAAACCPFPSAAPAQRLHRPPQPDGGRGRRRPRRDRHR